MQEKVETAAVQYVYLDVFEFTHADRTVEEMVNIMAWLNRCVRLAMSDQRIPVDDLILLPHGHSLCIALLNQGLNTTHVALAEAIRNWVLLFNTRPILYPCSFHLRIAVDEGRDQLITDIIGGRNLVGPVIERAVRLLGTCGADEIVISDAVHVGISRLARYKGRYQHRKQTLGSGEVIDTYVGTPAPDGKHANDFDRLMEAANYRQGPRLGPEDLAELRPRMPLLHAVYGVCQLVQIGKLVDGKREAELHFYSRTESVVLTPYDPMYFKALQ